MLNEYLKNGMSLAETEHVSMIAKRVPFLAIMLECSETECIAYFKKVSGGIV